MFIDFMLALREQGLSVSLDEWLVLMEALDQEWQETPCWNSTTSAGMCW